MILILWLLVGIERPSHRTRRDTQPIISIESDRTICPCSICVTLVLIVPTVQLVVTEIKMRQAGQADKLPWDATWK